MRHSWLVVQTQPASTAHTTCQAAHWVAVPMGAILLGLIVKALHTHNLWALARGP